MTLSISNVFTPASQQGWLTTLLNLAATLGLPTTAWQSGGVARTIITLMSYMGASQDGIISQVSQGGFLDFAATGTVTYTNTQGNTVTVPVTPDPSVASQLQAWLATNGGGWEDILADGVYNVQRIGAGQAQGPMAFANTTGSSYGPYAVGTYHASNGTTNATYTNTAVFTIAAQSLVGTVITAVSNTTPIQITTSTNHGLSSGAYVKIAGTGTGADGQGSPSNTGIWQIAVVDAKNFTLNSSLAGGAAAAGTVNVCSSGTFAADVPGVSGTSGPNAVQQLTTSNVGVTGTNPVVFTGSNYEGNVALANRCRLKLQALSPNGPSGAYLYFALSASQFLAATFTSDSSATPLTLTGGPITRAIDTTDQSTGKVSTIIANATGPVTGLANVALTGATNATPIVVTLTGANLNTSIGANGTVFECYVAGVVGNSAANGYWNATVVSATTCSLGGSAGSGAYVSGGTIEAGDLGLVDSVIQTNCVPNAVTGTTVSALAQNVIVTGTVFVPASQVTAFTLALSVALANYFSSLPIGGVNTDNATNVLSLEDLIGAVRAAGTIAGSTNSYVKGMLDVGVQIANTAGPGATVSSATGAGVSPIVLTFTAAHNVSTGAEVVVSGATGNTGMNGRFVVTKLSALTLSLNGSTGNGAYTTNTATVVLVEGDLSVGATSVLTQTSIVQVVGQ